MSARIYPATPVRTPAPETTVGILRGLARGGDRSALAQTLRAMKSRDLNVASTARFAAVLISHRLGLTPRALQAPPRGRLCSVDRPSARPLMIRLTTVEDAQPWLASLAQDPFGIPLTAQRVYRIHCPARPMMLLMNRDLLGVETVDRLERRSALLGVVACRSRHDPSYFVSLLITTRPIPGRRAIAIEVFSTRGTTAFVGTGVVRGGKIRFSVRSRARAGVVAALVEGTLGDDGIAITTSLAEP